jgi:hypothetical protein
MGDNTKYLMATLAACITAVGLNAVLASGEDISYFEETNLG